MIRKRILLASLLKPVSDTRLYEKIGQSLAKLPQVEVHVAGYNAPLPSYAQSDKITFHPVFDFKRISFGRLGAQLKYWRLLKKVKPALLVVGTHELLPLGWLYCRLHSCQLVYDVQENYFLNLLTQKVYPGVLGKILGHAVRSLEHAIAPSISHFFLAEEAYRLELPFIGHRYTVLQNKYLPPTQETSVPRSLPVILQEEKPLRLLYSGTISRLYGVMEAITFTQNLRQWVPSAELTIIGYAADAAFLEEVKARVAPLCFVTLLGGNTLVPHNEILAQEKLHHIGLLPYRPHPSTFTCVPTKLFEYIGNGLVVIMESNPLWQKILQDHEAGVVLPFARAITPKKIEALLEKPYYQNGIPEQVFWMEEESTLQGVVIKLLSL
ncbi:glycosyltransferase family protein [Rufibacter hautae]|uniref:Glycosyltransferase family 4 protein n=1 Tax=Rufibacter hautae TaxID=2595005 RepID=A0A5B6TFA9_9BACT|nr:glycosyltransferase family 4 protein [Rufibacter hautae]KAA3438054.1 glycosyltransferase family 4 protein [Rufibacter hautae]